MKQSTTPRVLLKVAAATIGLVVVGCGVSQKAEAEPIESGLDEVFTLRGGQDATIGDEGLGLRFDRVLEDSRCPTQVECFWTGQARIALLVSPVNGEPATVEFNTNPAPGQNVQTVQAGAYTLDLKSLDPYPETPDQSIPLDEYRATLIVQKG